MSPSSDLAMCVAILRRAGACCSVAFCIRIDLNQRSWGQIVRCDRGTGFGIVAEFVDRTKIKTHVTERTAIPGSERTGKEEEAA